MLGFCRDCKVDEKSCDDDLIHTSIEPFEEGGTVRLRQAKLRFECQKCHYEGVELQSDYTLKPTDEDFTYFSVTATCMSCEDNNALARPKYFCAESKCRSPVVLNDAIMTTEPNSQCPVCLDDELPPGTFMIRFSRCDCRICFDCAGRSLKIMLDNSQLVTTSAGLKAFGCPGGHQDSILLHRHTVLLAGESQVNRYKRFQAEAEGQRQGGFCFCPECKGFISGPFPSNSVTCPVPSCSHRFDRASPPPVPAEAELVDPHAHEQCPFCRTRITHYRHDGCHHIGHNMGGCPGINPDTGERCSKHWCYICKAEWKSPDNDNCRSTHFFCNSTCPCPLDRPSE